MFHLTLPQSAAVKHMPSMVEAFPPGEEPIRKGTAAVASKMNGSWAV
jgi:hypothetical protein